MWKACQWRWSLDYYEGRRSRVNGVYLTFGSAIHDALETLKDPKQKKARPEIQDICWVFEVKFRSGLYSYLDEENKKLELAGRKKLTSSVIQNFVDAGNRIIKNLHHCNEIEDAEVLFVEHPIFINIDRSDDVNIKFKGFIDIVLRTKDKRGKSIIYICDYKTCSWGWGRDKRTNEDLAAQIRLYKHFFSKEFNINPNLIKCSFILCKRTPKTPETAVEFLPISAGKKTVARAVNNINLAITGMNSGNFTKNRNECTNAFGDVCPYFNTVDCPNI